MKALEMSESLPINKRAKIDDISAALELDRDEGRQLAGFMQEEGWVKLDYGPAEPTLWVTLEGRKAIAKLRLPRLRRWIDANPGLWLTILTPALSIASAILVKVVEKWLGLE